MVGIGIDDQLDVVRRARGESLAKRCRGPVVLGADQDQERKIEAVDVVAVGIVRDDRAVPRRDSAVAACGDTNGRAATQRQADESDAIRVHERQRRQMIEGAVSVLDLHGIVFPSGLAAVGDAAGAEAVDDERDVAVLVQQRRVPVQPAPDGSVRRVPLGPAAAVHQHDGGEGAVPLGFGEPGRETHARLVAGDRRGRSLRLTGGENQRERPDHGADGALSHGLAHGSPPAVAAAPVRVHWSDRLTAAAKGAQMRAPRKEGSARCTHSPVPVVHDRGRWTVVRNNHW